jgi:hypothetical protein
LGVTGQSTGPDGLAEWRALGSASQSGRERRSGERRRTLGRAIAFQSAPLRRFACVIRDFSEGGCRLVGADIDVIHSRFVLSLDGLAGEPRRCEVAWRQRRMIGVRFLDMVAEPVDRAAE